MPEIVPAIIAKNFADLEDKIKSVAPYVKTAQLDIMDGVFVPNRTWPYFDVMQGLPLQKGPQGEPLHRQMQSAIKDLAQLQTDLFLEAHLMVAEPENTIDAWLKSKVGRVIVHYEAVKKISNFPPYGRSPARRQFPISNLAQRTHQANKEFGIALNLETPIDVLDEFLDDVDLVLLMSVNPGFSGQEFQEEVIHKAGALRQTHKSVRIEIDGGINLDTAKKLDLVKVDFLAVGSAIFESGDIKKAIYEIKKILEL